MRENKRYKNIVLKREKIIIENTNNADEAVKALKEFFND